MKRKNYIMFRKQIKKILIFICAIAILTPYTVGAAPVIWICDSSGRLGTVDIADGSVNVIGDMGIQMTDIAFDPNGNLYGATYDDLYAIDKTTGITSLIGNLNGTRTHNSLAFDSSGILYTADTSLYTVNTTTGAASLVGNGGYSYASRGGFGFCRGKTVS